ncbi:MAG: alpha/beta fold hydrolase [Bacteroidetes bacterium]|nr:alpha/beta fold hydrolase [Bacteroidota bacterium]MCL1968311.1 alpha/beta fold hydrolase [Bacteroidota bacterium]
MKKIISIILLTFLLGYVNGQNITGQWNGILKVPGQSLKLVFHIQESDSGYTATIDVPDQNTFGKPVTELSFESNNLKINIQSLAIHYEGTLHNDTIKGIFKQKGFPMSLNLYKKEQKRPQEPQKPYPYYEEEVWFDNLTAPGTTLVGTLTLPNQQGVFPAVILVSGSGAQNRDEEVFEHKPFLVIADYLTRNGIAVLRYDDRGTAASTGVHDTCSTYDFSTDAEAAFKYLQGRKEINPKQIGFIGHSEGGMIAPLVAARNKEVGFIILLAAPGIKGDSLLFLQRKLTTVKKTLGANKKEIEKVLNMRRRQDSIIIHTADAEQLERNMTALFEEFYEKQVPSLTPEEKEETVRTEVRLFTSKFYQYLIKYDPAPTLAQVRCPVLALNGEKDVQVSAEENLNAIEKIFLESGNTDITIKKISKLNHLFQTSQTGNVSEYAEIEETFSQEVLEIMLDWLREKIQN